MKLIKMFKRNVNILVDDEDYEYLNQFRWIKRSSYGYPARHIQSRPKQIYKFMHHEILKTNQMIDHINGNVLDNRKQNLRITNKSKNAANCKIHKHNTSGFKGVSKMKQTNKYIAYIVVNNKQYRLGTFNNKEAAAKAYNDAATKYFGEFARLNNLP